MIYKRRRIASIDIGSNSILMVVAERNEQGILTLIHDAGEITRLAEGLRATKELSSAAITRTTETFKKFCMKAKECSADEIVATATAAVREAKNQSTFLDQAKTASGCEVEVILPNEEARLTYISVTTEPQGDAPSMVVDIGGGSTEITWGLGPRFDGGRSLDLGTVKLIEGPLVGNPPLKAAIDAAKKEIDFKLSRVTPLSKLDHYYGTAGSFTLLASIDLAQSGAPYKEGHRLTHAAVSKWIETFSTMTVEEISKLPGSDPRRADVLLAGTLIIERLFAKFGNDTFEVHDRGVRFGKLFDKLRGFTPPVQMN